MRQTNDLHRVNNNCAGYSLTHTLWLRSKSQISVSTLQCSTHQCSTHWRTNLDMGTVVPNHFALTGGDDSFLTTYSSSSSSTFLTADCKQTVRTTIYHT